MTTAWLCEKSQKRLPSLPVKAGWILGSEVSLKSKFWKCGSWTRLISCAFLKNWTWACDHLKSSNLSADNFKNIRTQWVNTRAHDTIRRYWSADTLFRQLSIDQNMDVHYRVAGSQTSLKVWDYTLVCLWCGRTEDRASRCTVTWMPNFLGWKDFLSYEPPLKIQNWARDQIKYQLKI